MFKHFRRLLFFSALLFGVSLYASDVIVVLDTSGSTLSYYDEINEKVLKEISINYLKKGDEFHLISFNSSPRLEMSQVINSEKDFSRVVSKFLFLYPLAKNSNFLLALDFLENYLSSLPTSHEKKLIFISDGNFNPPLESEYAKYSKKDFEKKLNDFSSYLSKINKIKTYYIKLPISKRIMLDLKNNLSYFVTSSVEMTLIQPYSDICELPLSLKEYLSFEQRNNLVFRTKKNKESLLEDSKTLPIKNIEKKENITQKEKEIIKENPIEETTLIKENISEKKDVLKESIKETIKEEIIKESIMQEDKNVAKENSRKENPIEKKETTNKNALIEDKTEKKIAKKIEEKNIIKEDEPNSLTQKTEPIVGTIIEEKNVVHEKKVEPEKTEKTIEKLKKNSEKISLEIEYEKSTEEPKIAENIQRNEEAKTGFARLDLSEKIDNNEQKNNSVLSKYFFYILGIFPFLIVIFLLMLYKKKRIKKIDKEVEIKIEKNDEEKKNEILLSSTEECLNVFETSCVETKSIQKDDLSSSKEKVIEKKVEYSQSAFTLSSDTKKAFAKGVQTKTFILSTPYIDFYKFKNSLNTKNYVQSVDATKKNHLEMFVLNQRRSIGMRNIHTLKQNKVFYLGGGKHDDFFIFLVPIPRKLASIYYDGENVIFKILKPEYFPYEKEREIKNPLNRFFVINSEKKYSIYFMFRIFEQTI
ncbi:MAG: VWA domain-containing protein [Treponema sp.]